MGSSLGFSFKPIENHHVQAQLNPGELYVTITRNSCDCDTVLGSCCHPAERLIEPEREIAKLRKKGWSEAKIARSLSQKQTALEKNAKVREAEEESLTPAAEKWIRAISKLLQDTDAKYLGLILHWYSGGLSERITIKERKSLKLLGLDPRVLLEMENDVLYLFSLA